MSIKMYTSISKTQRRSLKMPEKLTNGEQIFVASQFLKRAEHHYLSYEWYRSSTKSMFVE